MAPCYDLATAAPFLFSRADIVDSDNLDFHLRDVCAATCAVRSLDGRTVIATASGGGGGGGGCCGGHHHASAPQRAGVPARRRRQRPPLIVSIGSGSFAGTITTAANPALAVARRDGPPRCRGCTGRGRDAPGRRQTGGSVHRGLRKWDSEARTAAMPHGREGCAGLLGTARTERRAGLRRRGGRQRRGAPNPGLLAAEATSA
ncbi:hypothetical protein SEVIR_1G124266v4 [Setaria viridis]